MIFFWSSFLKGTALREEGLAALRRSTWKTMARPVKLLNRSQFRLASQISYSESLAAANRNVSPCFPILTRSDWITEKWVRSRASAILKIPAIHSIRFLTLLGRAMNSGWLFLGVVRR